MVDWVTTKIVGSPEDLPVTTRPLSTWIGNAAVFSKVHGVSLLGTDKIVRRGPIVARSNLVSGRYAFMCLYTMAEN